jgi:imidazolonepropionase-like amidohydrolase
VVSGKAPRLRAAMAGLALLVTQAAHAAEEKDVVALQGVTIVDLRSGEKRTAQTVVWDRSRIVVAGASSVVRVPANARVVDGGGRYLMPGLWDMHVHLMFDQSREKASEEQLLPLFIVNGVTSVRDMSDVEAADYRRSAIPVKRRWDIEARAGLRAGPRIVAAGSYSVDGPSSLPEDGSVPSFMGAGTPAEARKLVRFFADEGDADFIKVYSRIPRDSYFAMMDEARHAGIVVAGHKPLAVSYVEAANAGQRSLEHAREILLDSFPGALDLQRNPAERNLPPARLDEILKAHDPRMLREIFDAMVRNGAYYTPTHLTRLFDWKASAGDAAYLDDRRLRLLPKELRESAAEDVKRTQGRASKPGDSDVYRAFFEKGLDVTRQAHAAGVKIMAGTDAGDSYCFHGSSLHDELGWMVKAGLPTLAVLRAATIVPAEYVGRTADFGAVEPGRIADMVLLDADPLADIANTRRIRAVVSNGRYYDRAELDEVLAGVERAATD